MLFTRLLTGIPLSRSIPLLFRLERLRLPHRLGRYIFFIAFFSFIGGCAGIGKTVETSVTESQSPQLEDDQKTEDIKIREFMLSPGDEINITVYRHEELTRHVRIPPDGQFFYPLVGKVSASSKSLSELRETITNGLSEPREQLLIPGDEISIAVYRHDNLSRTFIIPPDGYIFFPLVGEVKVAGITARGLRALITSGLEEYRKPYLTPSDEIIITVYRQEELDRKVIIPSDGHIFFPLAGEIKAAGKTINELRVVITEKLSKFIANPQVSVDLSTHGGPKIVVDPQVTVDIKHLASPNTIADPQVSIEVVKFGGQKFYVLGEVFRPGVYTTDGNTTMIEAISLAGGPTLDADQGSIAVVRPTKGKLKPEMMVVDMKTALVAGDMTQNPVIQKGDIIFVSRTFISNVDRFFEHLGKMTKPLLDITTGIWIGQNIDVGPQRVIGIQR